MCDHHSSGGLRFAGLFTQLLHQVFERKTVKSKPAYSGVDITPGNCVQLCDPGNVAVEGGIEACNLRNSVERFATGFDECDLRRQVRQIEFLRFAKLRQDLRSDYLMRV